MLSSLHIENIAVVKSADIDFMNGFNVMTGETGAGKSVIIGSINLLMGQRFGKEIIDISMKKIRNLILKFFSYQSIL